MSTLEHDLRGRFAERGDVDPGRTDLARGAALGALASGRRRARLRRIASAVGTVTLVGGVGGVLLLALPRGAEDPSPAARPPATPVTPVPRAGSGVPRGVPAPAPAPAPAPGPSGVSPGTPAPAPVPGPAAVPSRRATVVGVVALPLRRRLTPAGVRIPASHRLAWRVAVRNTGASVERNVRVVVVLRAPGADPVVRRVSIARLAPGRTVTVRLRGPAADEVALGVRARLEVRVARPAGAGHILDDRVVYPVTITFG